MRLRLAVLILLSAPALGLPAKAPADTAAIDPFARLDIYQGDWAVRAAHPWSGAPPGATDRLTSHCERFARYFVCEQTVNGSPASLIVYTASDSAGQLNTRVIAPNGLAGGRGDLTLVGARWTYIDKPPAPLKGDWSKTVNLVSDRDHIHFEEYQSSDQGLAWRLINTGEETREKPAT